MSTTSETPCSVKSIRISQANALSICYTTDALLLQSDVYLATGPLTGLSYLLKLPVSLQLFS